MKPATPTPSAVLAAAEARLRRAEEHRRTPLAVARARAAYRRARAAAEAAAAAPVITAEKAAERFTSASVAWLGGWGTPGRFGLAEALHAAAADYCRACGLPPETPLEEAQAHLRANWYNA